MRSITGACIGDTGNLMAETRRSFETHPAGRVAIPAAHRACKATGSRRIASANTEEKGTS